MNRGGSPYMRPTPQFKQVAVADNLGNPGIKNNQGTSVEVYDYVEVLTSAQKQVVEWFNRVGSKTFPFCNIVQNQLQVGESLAIEYAFFTYAVITKATGAVKSSGALQSIFPGANLSLYAVNLDNNRIVKPISLMRCNTEFNPHGKTSNNYVFYPDNDLVLPTQIQFTAELQIPPITVSVDEGDGLYFGIHWTGSGAILNLKTNV